MQHQFKRRIFYSTNVMVSVVLACVLAAIINLLANKYPLEHDFIQSTAMFRLSEKTKNVLAALSNDVEFFVFSNTQSSDLGPKVERLLKAYQSGSRHVKVTSVDSLRDVEKIRRLVRDLDVEEPDTVIIKYGDAKKVLTEMKMADFHFDHNADTGDQIKRLVALKAEQAFTSALVELMNPQQLIARFTVKHGERSLFEYKDTGLSEAKRYLERDNITAEPLELVGMNDITATNCDVLVVAGPTKRFMDHEINLLRRYFTKGGKAIILLDPEIETGLEPLLAEFNIKVGMDTVVDPATRQGGFSPLMLIIGQYGDHPITRLLRTYSQFFIARSVSVMDENNTVNSAQVLAATSDSGWGETDTDADSFKYQEGKDIAGPVSIAVAVENEKSGLRLVVVGDADFVVNRDLSASTGNGANRDLFLNAVNWAMQREYLVSIGPKTTAEVRRLRLNKGQSNIVAIAVLVVTPLCAVIAGVIVYFIRRK